MRRYVLLLLISFMAQSAFCENTEKKKEFKIGLSGGLAFFNETDLKKLNTDIISVLPFEVQIIDNFPSTICYGGYVLSSLNSWFSIGLNYQYYTTGSKIGARDYSGLYSVEQIISAHSPGLHAEILLKQSKCYLFYFESIAGMQLARWKLNETTQLGDQQQVDNKELNALKPFLFPGFKIMHPLIGHLNLGVTAGYSFDLGGKYRFNDDKQSKATTKVPFSGLKLKIAVEYKF